MKIGMFSFFPVALVMLCSNAGAQSTAPTSGNRPGFTSSVVMKCTELARGGAAHKRASVIQNINDFGTSFEVKIYDVLVSSKKTIADLTNCSGDIASESLICDDSKDTVHRPGFLRSFRLKTQLSGIAEYTGTSDFGGTEVVSFDCADN